MTNTTPSPDPSAPATPSGSGAKEVETYRRRQVTAFRGFVIGIALGAITTGLRVLLASDRPYAD